MTPTPSVQVGVCYEIDSCKNPLREVQMETPVRRSGHGKEEATDEIFARVEKIVGV